MRKLKNTLTIIAAYASKGKPECISQGSSDRNSHCITDLDIPERKFKIRNNSTLVFFAEEIFVYRSNR